MSIRVSFLRRAAGALMAHASGVLPGASSAWSDAMKSELHHIESDAEAFTWAAGCVAASYVERSGVMMWLRNSFVRAFLALLIFSQVLNFLFATVLTAAYRLHFLELAEGLGRGTPGDDYRRFIPLMDATPWWVHGLWIAASVVFAFSAWQLIRDKRAAFPLFAAAWILGEAGNFIPGRIPASRQVFSFPAPSFMRDVLIPSSTTALLALIAAALWAHGWCFLTNAGGRAKSLG
ncbi:MAG TPA: hypothetical protein VGG72_36195 [Bryobacteraceae bacterium]|jgi:hypothetical protein